MTPSTPPEVDRVAAAQAAIAARRARAAVKASVAHRQRRALEVAEAAWNGPATAPEATLRVRELLMSVPTLGPTRADRVMEQVLRDRDYYVASGGGLTVSGGEPLAQADFTAALLELAHDAGVHTCLDTSGWAPERTIRRMAGLVDLWLFDLKATGEDEHRRLTGVAAGPVLANLDRLLAAGARVRLRLPLVPGVNDTDQHLEHVAAIVADHPELDGVDVLPYHSWGTEKAAERGIALPYGDLPTTSPEVAAELVERLHRLGCTAAR